MLCDQKLISISACFGKKIKGSEFMYIEFYLVLKVHEMNQMRYPTMEIFA